MQTSEKKKWWLMVALVVGFAAMALAGTVRYKCNKCGRIAEFGQNKGYTIRCVSGDGGTMFKQ